MAKPDLGSKQKCQNCGTKFFDMNKDPITCPKCGTILQAVGGASAARAPAGNADSDDEDTEAESGAEVVSLEDAETTEDGKVTAVDPDEDVEDDTGTDDDDTFLEEEEEDDGDVADLIDGDIEEDDER